MTTTGLPIHAVILAPVVAMAGKVKVRRNPKTNFSEEFLAPAARGELKEKHSSGIPKLAARKTKGHNIQGGWGDDTNVENASPEKYGIRRRTGDWRRK